jgi:predicted outer membrane protein
MKRRFARHLLYVAIGGMVLCLTGCGADVKPQSASEPVLSPTDKAFVINAQLNTRQQRVLGNFIKTKSKNKEVKQYAEALVNSDSDELQELDTIMQKYHIEPSTGEEQQAVAPLNGLSRQALDRKFVGLIVEDQQKAVTSYKGEADAAKTTDIGQFAAGALSGLQSDLKKAEALQAKLEPKTKQAHPNKSKPAVHSASF